MRFLDTRVGSVELALDGHPRAVIYAMGDQVNSRIRLAVVIAPINPAGDLIELCFQRGIGLEIVDH